jgi:hypothetical protein
MGRFHESLGDQVCSLLDSEGNALARALLTQRVTYMVKECRNAIVGLGTNTVDLINFVFV